MTDVSASFRPPCWCPSGHQHGVSIQISINSGKPRHHISSIGKFAMTWILAGVFAYLSSFYLQILNLIYWTVLIFLFLSILNGATLKTSNTKENKLANKSSNIGKTPTTNQCRRVPDLWRPGSVKIKRYYTKNGRLIPTSKRGKEIKQPWNKTSTI